ncbi:ATP synthase I [Desulfofarcimen acetoxidans DSM 771]|jgi:ATP synthase protein I|uniref:ATP synthase I n=1 Tax=Desulfofarcimen acetoxidans (strain ATCC 49208 / DSM 771 / KCTC 5769 / VKM B-1644 / 5575) TaxID=485916 RepID=C8VZ95_DESAS|nr:ATP synthase subunit I [Desulfofarcimen acetoxidans]ACV64840.1 ATP synthase I [Desulfofarcimen acetoxidans DSM 771]
MLTPAPIPDLTTQFSRTRKITLIITGLVVAGIVLTSGSPFLWGLLIGLAVGLYNAFTLHRRLGRIGEFSPPRAKKYMFKGMAMRFTTICAVLFAVRNIAWIDLHGIGAGLLIPPLVAIFDLAVSSFKESFQQAMASQAMQVNSKLRRKGGENV